ncbi:MAG TPA: putative lipid II flippase FtsW [Candidatus Portnoybacteria bacterium]|jgi:cell division protein FtsW|nr:putative lipid II flippase FtsW [Candidatus Portnoybacteria bacterium]MDD5752211.1 putative lipid II flippase FtsW [Candidatus Portnoybacteria bacterium]HNU96939.1 putative lipid II flippase FtsW [Candidatus Portnoybacteria bacterium]HOZ16577.1 putative lipid II flippase FtsW [Candidatus Portnoybacteria bacterium]HPH52204.1 putative lipid II flippase FtsW [Candidatus Portnoybacteria bacterium]
MKKKKSHKRLIILIFFLLIFGLGILFNASTVISQEQTGKPYYYFFHQLLYGGLLGIICFFIASKINYKIFKKFSLLFFFISLTLCVLVFVPSLGMKYGGAQRWLSLGPITFQPSELLKLGLIIYLAAFFSKNGKNYSSTNKLTTLLPFLTIIAISGGLIALQNDVGTLSLIAIIGFVMYFLSGTKLLNIVIVAFVYILGFLALIKFFPHRIQRIMTFLNPSLDPQGISYQINQALVAIGSGGLTGRGLGHSIQKYNYLPEAMSDSIFAIMAEEIGFIGCLIFIILMALFILEGFKIAQKSNNDFGKLLTCGIVVWFGFQTLINIGAITGLIPLTGIPLPFVSYGSSALIINLVAAGILVNIAKHAN